uniref:ATP synthase CFO B chain subunit I n=1 Tax=Rhodochaete parvula TaxID=110510 RepID=A0A220T0L4_9RHOD|nr:ATP synthase CFO B chain subunit I [Rhodochaete parvula]
MNIVESLVQNFILISEHAAGNGFGINTNILETNFINIAILVSILVYVGKPFLSSTLQTRQEKVLTSIQEAESKLQQANNKQSTFVYLVIDNIKKDAITTANKVRDSIMEQGELDIARITDTGKVSILATENQIRKQIQQQIAALALKRVTTNLKSEMNSELQSKIIDNSINKLGGQL